MPELGIALFLGISSGWLGMLPSWHAASAYHRDWCGASMPCWVTKRDSSIPWRGAG